MRPDGDDDGDGDDDDGANWEAWMKGRRREYLTGMAIWSKDWILPRFRRHHRCPMVRQPNLRMDAA